MRKECYCAQMDNLGTLKERRAQHVTGDELCETCGVRSECEAPEQEAASIVSIGESYDPDPLFDPDDPDDLEGWAGILDDPSSTRD